MRNKKYSKPIMNLEVFTPQEYINSCDAVITNTFDGFSSFPPNTHFYPDTGIMGSLDADDYIDHRETYKKNWTEMEVNINDLLVYYWAAEQSIAQEISADLKNGYHNVYDSYVSSGQAGKVVGFPKNPGGNQVVAGTIKEGSYKNQS